MSEPVRGPAAVTSLHVLLGKLLGTAVFLFALAALGLFLASALGLIPWLTIEARFGETALPDAGAWLEGAVAVLGLILLLYLPAQRRVLALERAHRSFHVNMDDVARAYAAAHEADRKGAFALSGEFDAMRERLSWMRQHPDLGTLEPELLELAAQMSLQSRDLAIVYSEERVARARGFLRARQQEAHAMEERVAMARQTCEELKRWLTDVEVEERKLSENIRLLERDLREVLPALGYELEDAPAAANVVPLPKSQK